MRQITPQRWTTPLFGGFLKPEWISPHWMWPSDEPFPDFCHGAAYTFSSSTVQPLYEQMLKNDIFSHEDIYLTGIIRSKCLGIPIVDDFLFHTNVCRLTDLFNSFKLDKLTNENFAIYEPCNGHEKLKLHNRLKASQNYI